MAVKDRRHDSNYALAAFVHRPHDIISLYIRPAIYAGHAVVRKWCLHNVVQNAGVRMDSFRFFSYYWTVAKHLWLRVWDKKGSELISTLVLAAVTFVVSRVFKQVDSLTAFEIAIVSLFGWLAVISVGHLIHAPVLLHDREVYAKAHRATWGVGLLGVVIAILIVASLTAVGIWYWVDRDTKLIFPIPDTSALQVEVDQQRNEIAALKDQIPAEDSLKVRASNAADEYEQFWHKQPKAPTCTQTSSMTPEEQRKALEPCSVFWNRRQGDYERLMAPRIIEIVAEFKAKGVDVLNIENCASSGYCGIPLSVQLRAFALRLDAHDHLKH